MTNVCMTCFSAAYFFFTFLIAQFVLQRFDSCSLRTCALKQKHYY